MTIDRLLTPEEQPQDQDKAFVDVALRPTTLKDFVGQKKSCENLSIFILSATQRKQALDHVLLYGPPGLGKTTLAHIISKEMGVGFRSTSGPIISKAGDLAAILTNLEPFDVLFIDEIHRLAPAVEEVLYPSIEDFKLDIIIGEGPSARSIQIDLPPFTLIGATTRSGLITRPLRERFGIPLPLQFYAPEELQSIISTNAKKLNMNLTTDGALEIAKRCRGTPRIAGRLLRRVRDISTVQNLNIINAHTADTALKQLEIDNKGFDAMDRRYLSSISSNYEGGPVGIDTLSASLSEQRDVLEDVIEPYLIQQGFIIRTPRGRKLTQKAFHHLELDAPQRDFFEE